MGGLWEKYDLTEVASPFAWQQNRELVLRFYNERRKQLLESYPNGAHLSLAELEEYFEVHIITQNVDDLHERAGSSNILHLHGEIRKSRSTINSSLIYTIEGWELKEGDVCKEGSQLRPHIVWFGESVPNIPEAVQIAKTADIFLVIGTSLNVYPAAGIIDFLSPNIPLYLIDPHDVGINIGREYSFINESAVNGMEILKKELILKYT
jgi:NAD-dependent protein deacetylase/lipoamidase